MVSIAFDRVDLPNTIRAARNEVRAVTLRGRLGRLLVLMDNELSATAVPTIPPGFVAVPISVNQLGLPLRICVVARSAGGGLVALEDVLDARVLLGCVSDAGSRVHQWLEIWVQNVADVLAAAPTARDSLSNAALDKPGRRPLPHWSRWRADTFQTGWEAEPAPPTWIDLKSAKPVHPVDEATHKRSGMCRDESALAEAGLASYATTLHRYLYIPEHPAESPFVAITPNALPLISVHPSRIAFSWPFGLRAVRVWGVAAGAPREPADPGRTCRPAGRQTIQQARRPRAVPREFVPRLTMDDAGVDGDGWLFMGRHGR